MSVFSIESFYALDPIAFEDTAKSLLIQMGFDATTTKASGDGGVDIVAMNEQPIISCRLSTLLTPFPQIKLTPCFT